MSSPILWIFVPAFAAVLLLSLRHHPRLMIWLGAGLMLSLAAAAWWIPIGNAIRFGTLSFKLEDTFLILGRKLVLGSGDRAILTLIYLMGAVWFFGSLVVKTQPYFIPGGIFILALLTAAMAVQPSLYAAMLIELAVLVSIPLLAPPGHHAGKGIKRYLIFQTLGMPFLVMTSWILSGFEAGPTDAAQILRAEIMLGLGFAFLLAIFPFYTWIPLMAEEVYPYTAGFILIVFPTVTLLFSLIFIDKYTWLKTSATVFSAIRLAGGLMIVTGGVWAAFQRHLGRMLGYGVIMETGFSLLALSLNTPGGYEIFSEMFLPRILNLGLGFLALSLILKERSSLDLMVCSGIARESPVVTAGFLVSAFSIAGFPLLAAFPGRYSLFQNLSVQGSALDWWILIGIEGYFIGCLNQMAVLIRGNGPFQMKQDLWRLSNLLLVGGIAFQMILGLFPQLFLPQVVQILAAFKNLMT